MSSFEVFVSLMNVFFDVSSGPNISLVFKFRQTVKKFMNGLFRASPIVSVSYQ